jgi:hypothetical protein
MGNTIYNMPGVLQVDYDATKRAAIAHYTKLGVPTIREAIEKGLAAAGNAGARTWIIDLTLKPGVPTQPDAEWIGTVAVALVKKNNIKSVVNVHGASAIARMGSARWTKSATEADLPIYDCDSMADALEIAGRVAAGQTV